MSPLTLVSADGGSVGRRGWRVRARSSSGGGGGGGGGAGAGQYDSGLLTVGGGVETDLSTLQGGPVQASELPITVTFFNDNPAGGAYLQAYVRCGSMGGVWSGAGPIAPGSYAIVNVTGDAGCTLVASGYVANASSGAGAPPVNWRVHWDWGKPPTATPDTIICPPGTVGNSSWLATTPGSFYAGDVWGALRASNGALAVPSPCGALLGSAVVESGGWATLFIPGGTADVRLIGGSGMVQEARRSNQNSTNGINWGYALNHNASGSDELVHWAQTATGETPPHTENYMCIRINANHPSGYRLCAADMRHVKIVFVGGGAMAGTWEAYGDGGLGEGLFWGTLVDTAQDQVFEGDIPAATTYLQLVLHPTSGNVNTQKVWVNFSPMIVGCSPYNDWAIASDNAGWSFITTPYGTTHVIVPGGGANNVQNAYWTPAILNYGFTELAANGGGAAGDFSIPRTEASNHQFLAIRVNTWRPTSPVLRCNN